MNEPRLQPHLSQDDLLMVLAESGPCTPAAEDHLRSCPACRRELDRLQQRLNRLAETARRFSPKAARPFRLPHAESSPRRRAWLTPALAAGITAVLVLSVAVWWMTPPDRQSGAPRMLTDRQLDADQAFMTEVDQLVEDAMPEPYRELASIADLQVEWDEDLIDWIVPPIEDDDEPVS